MTLRIEAKLLSPLCGDAPDLAGLCEQLMARFSGQIVTIDRGDPPPPPGKIHIPMLRGEFGGVDYIPRCSSPILIGESGDVHEHLTRRVPSDKTDITDCRTKIATGGGWTKSYRLPVRVRRVDSVVWFCHGHRQPLKKLLRHVKEIGHKRGMGYGRVGGWELTDIGEDWSWFAPSDGEKILMRPLPFCDKLNEVKGWRRATHAVIPPCWHPDRMIDAGVPC